MLYSEYTRLVVREGSHLIESWPSKGVPFLQTPQLALSILHGSAICPDTYIGEICIPFGRAGVLVVMVPLIVFRRVDHLGLDFLCILHLCMGPAPRRVC